MIKGGKKAIDQTKEKIRVMKELIKKKPKDKQLNIQYQEYQEEYEYITYYYYDSVTKRMRKTFKRKAFRPKIVKKLKVKDTKKVEEYRQKIIELRKTIGTSKNKDVIREKILRL